jgi:hypothetical protein
MREAAPASNILLSASFTAADGTLIEDYTPEIGPAFGTPVPTGVIKIANNRPYVESSGANVTTVALADVGATDYTITARMGPEVRGALRIVFRANASNSENYIFYIYNTIARIYKSDNSILDNYSQSNIERVYEIVVSGSSVTVFTGGAEILSGTMDAFLSNTYVGFGNDSASGTDILLADDFVVTAI